MIRDLLPLHHLITPALKMKTNTIELSQNVHMICLLPQRYPKYTGNRMLDFWKNLEKGFEFGILYNVILCMNILEMK